ncbi:phage portal protein [Lactobacillus intestinalis]|uniref:phage portal protein n=1 Tax=Lactobacillus intestinalis TaxID=151781 RepID=UPI002670639F|nr:phage portal protein [Lactobacillus intestinalis]
MGLFSKVKNWFRPQELIESSHNSTWMGPNFDFSAWSNSDFSNSKNGILTTNEEIFSIISRLANMIASLPIHEYKKYEEHDDSLVDLIRTNPNVNQSGYDFINQLEVSRNTTGNGFAWIERDPYTLKPIALWPIDPGSVVVKRNTDDESIWYQVDDSDGHHFLVFNTDMIHVKHIMPVSRYLGISPIDVLFRSLRFQRKIEDFSLEEMGKKEAYIINYDRSVNKEGRKAILNDFRQMVKHNGGAILVEQGYKVDRYESKFKPSDLQTVEAISRARIANAFNVPLSFLNDGSTKSTTNVEHVMTQFVEMTLLPIVKQYESEFNRKLLTQNQRARGYYFKFNVNGLMRGDTAARTQFYQTLIRNGVATPNELRKLEDMPISKEKNADKLWFSKDLALLEEADKINIPNTPKGGENSYEQNDETSDKSETYKNQRGSGKSE